MYLAPHVKGLYGMIRNRGLIQYFSPYLSADLSRMARSFNTNVTSLEDELTKLILDNQIKARIDSHNKILYAKDVDQRTQTYEHALNVGKLTQQRSRVVLLRAAIHRAGIVVKAPPRGDSTNPLNVAMTSDVTVTPTNSGPSSPT
uniref:PCI domain-containing protein n=1 Tax=Romanomermis culicivorax TaxID=13658 RepID=A0A915J5V8_ROMCU